MSSGHPARGFESFPPPLPRHVPTGRQELAVHLEEAHRSGQGAEYRLRNGRMAADRFFSSLASPETHRLQLPGANVPGEDSGRSPRNGPSRPPGLGAAFSQR